VTAATAKFGYLDTDALAAAIRRTLGVGPGETTTDDPAGQRR
jgi:hypothetical protein